MRSILSISLPADMLASLSKKAKKTGLSVSAYVRRLLEHEEMLIGEEQLLKRVQEADRHYRQGKVKVLKSFDGLMQKA